MMRMLIGVILLVLSFENVYASSLLRYVSSQGENNADSLVGDHTDIICDAISCFPEEDDEFDYETKLSSLSPMYGKSEHLEKNEASNGEIMKELYAHIIEEFMNQDANPIGHFISLYAVLEMMELALINADSKTSFLLDTDSKPRKKEKIKWREKLFGKSQIKGTKRSEKKAIEGKTYASEDERVFVLNWIMSIENYRDFLDGKNTYYGQSTDQDREQLKKVSLSYIDLFIQCLEVTFSASLGTVETPYLIEARDKARNAAREFLRDYRNESTSWAVLWNSMVKGKLFPGEIERVAVRSKVTFLSFLFENKYILDLLTNVSNEISQYDEFFNARTAKKIFDNLRKTQEVEGAEGDRLLFDILTNKLEAYWKNNSKNVVPMPEVRLLKDSENFEASEES